MKALLCEDKSAKMQGAYLMIKKKAQRTIWLLSSIFYQKITTLIQLFDSRMPFKLKLIKNFQKYLTAQQTNLEEEKKSSTVATSEPPLKLKHKQRKFIRKTYSLFQMALRKTPLQNRHIVNFFNMVTLNEEAIRSEDCQESYFRSLFYTKTVRKVELRPHFIAISLTESDLQFPPIQYAINRFRSFGDLKFYQLANLMEQVAAKLKDLEHHQGKNERDISRDQVEEYLTSLGSKIFCVKTQGKYFISRSFLQILEYNPEDFALELIKYRMSLQQGCSCRQYFEVMSKVFENLSNLISLILDRISLETFLDNSIIRFRDYLYTRNHKKVHVKMKSGMPNPFVTIFEVEEVICVEEEFQQTPYFLGSRQSEVKRLRDQMREAEVKSLRHIIDFPGNYQPEYKHKVAGYIDSSKVSSLCHSSNTEGLKQQHHDII